MAVSLTECYLRALYATVNRAVMLQYCRMCLIFFSSMNVSRADKIIETPFELSAVRFSTTTKYNLRIRRSLKNVIYCCR